MELTRRRLLAGAVGGVAGTWTAGSFAWRDAVSITDAYALLNETADPPFVELGCVVANDASTRAAATVTLELELPDRTTRSATETVRPFDRTSDQALAAFEFPDRSPEALANGTARFALGDCRRLGLVPPLAIGCGDASVRTDVE